MKFKVERTSGKDPGCSNAQKELVPIKGELKEVYTVELNSLEELQQLGKEVEHPIIIYDFNSDIQIIEIYDYYRE